MSKNRHLWIKQLKQYLSINPAPSKELEGKLQAAKVKHTKEKLEINNIRLENINRVGKNPHYLNKIVGIKQTMLTENSQHHSLSQKKTLIEWIQTQDLSSAISIKHNWTPKIFWGLNILGPGNGTNRRSSLVGEGVALMEEVCLCGSGFWDPLSSCLRTVYSWLPLYEDAKLSVSPMPWLLECSMLPTLMIMDLSPEPVSQSQLNAILYKRCLGHGICS